MTATVTVIRITRHPIEGGREEALRAAFGQEINIVSDDVPYGDDPVKTVVGLIAKHGGNVVAIEVIAPVPTLAKLTQAKRELGRIKILRAEFARGVDGRPIVLGLDAAGREIFAFDHYDVIEQVLVVSKPL